jgi:carbon monoxide dehydrogenase subunit G
MSTIQRDVRLESPAADVWAVLRNVGRADLAFPGVLTASTIDGDMRTVTFANGFVACERIHNVDETARRIDYGVIGGPFTQHRAWMQIVPDGDGSRFLWTSEFQPDSVAEQVEPMIDAGVAAIQERFGTSP